MEEKDIHLLFDKYLNGEANTEEMQSLYDYFGIGDNDAVLLQLIQDYLHDSDDDRRLTDQIEADQITSDRWIAIADRTLAHSKVRRLHWIRYAAAIVIFCSVAIGFYIYSQRLSPTSSKNLNLSDKVVPGANKATLTFADGAKLSLDGSKQGIVIGEELTYSDGSKVTDMKSPLLVLSTPKGGQYRIELPDGTKVWLNAASSLRYPAHFDGDQRKVSLSGEAYFEVAHNTKQPFVVETSHQHLSVLGTVFNIHAYEEEGQTTTTLLEGKVALQSMGKMEKPIILDPGKQSILLADEFKVIAVDKQEAVAWKEGKFVFNGSDIYAVMRQIERWYDVEVIYEGDMANVLFTGSVSRFADIRTVAEKLELTREIKLTIQGRRIIVRKR